MLQGCSTRRRPQEHIGGSDPPPESAVATTTLPSAGVACAFADPQLEPEVLIGGTRTLLAWPLKDHSGSAPPSTLSRSWSEEHRHARSHPLRPFPCLSSHRRYS